MLKERKLSTHCIVPPWLDWIQRSRHADQATACMSLRCIEMQGPCDQMGHRILLEHELGLGE